MNPAQRISDQMVRLFSLNTTPRVTIDKNTNRIISVEYIWNDPEAEKLYHILEGMFVDACGKWEVRK